MEGKSNNNLKKIIIAFAFTVFLIHANSCLAIAGAASQTSSSKIFRAMARVYMADGNYTKAQSLAENALTLACEKTSLNNYFTIKHSGFGVQCVANQDAEYFIQNELDSSQIEEVSKCLIDLAFLYKNQGKYSKAQAVGELGLQFQKKIYYKDHPYIASTLRILSSIYQSQAKYELAEETLSQAICIMRKTHLSDDPALAPFQVDMARLLMAQGKLDEAQSIYLPAIEVINKSYGPDHLYTAGVLESLAELYALQAKYEEAEKLIEKTLAIQEKAYGSEHYLMIPSWLTKAEICQANGDYEQAEKLIKTALNTAEKYLGAGHPTTGKILSRLGSLYVMRLLENKQIKVS
jgi:tetratricopeptide (TPR) repeat protein